MFFKHFDYLGNVFGFTYDDSMRYQTNCGGFLSLILGLLSIIVVCWMGITLFDRTNPLLVQDVAKNQVPPTVYFENRFNIAMRISAGSDNLYKDLDMITIKLVVNYVYDSNFSNITTSELSLYQCTPDKFPPNVRDDYDNMNLNHSLCPDLNGYKIEGDFLSLHNTFLQIQFEMCENDPITGTSTRGNGIKCKSHTEIMDFLQNNSVKAHIFYTDSNYISKNYDDPLDTYISNYNINIFFYTQRESHLFFTLSNLTSDDTYFFLSPSKRYFSSISNSAIQERAAYREYNMNDFVILNIQSDDNVSTINRSYNGFADIAANVGAILNLVMLYFSSVVFLITRIQFFSRLMKHTIYLYYRNPQFMINLTSENSEKIIRDGNKKMTTQGKVNQESLANLNNTSLQEGKLKPVNIEMLNINKGTETKNTNNTFLTKLKNNDKTEIAKKLENFQMQKYDHEKKLHYMIILSFCPCLNICSKKIERDISVMEYSKKHYYRYTDFFRFLDKFIELNIFKKLFLKKEEQEMIDVLKRIILVKKFDILDLINPKIEESNLYKTTGAALSDKLKKKGSLLVQEEKLRKYISLIVSKENKSTIETNFLEKFDDLLKG
jgi:hypothetical protein